MSTKPAVNACSIQDFVRELRKFPESAFLEVTQLQPFLNSHPIEPDTLAPNLVWDRQHYTRNLIEKTPL